MSYDDYEPCTLCTTSYPRARKEHRCLECGGKILPGEAYQLTDYLFDGSFGQQKLCDDCRKFMLTYKADPCFNGLFEWVWNGDDEMEIKAYAEIMRRRQTKNVIQLKWLEDWIKKHANT